MTRHVHLTSDGACIGTIFVGDDGTARGDGGPAAQGAIYYTNHGVNPSDGPQLLDAIVRHFDRTTYVGAYHCTDPHCSVLAAAVEGLASRDPSSAS